MDIKSILHPEAVWRDHGDTSVPVIIPRHQDETPQWVEYLWCKQLEGLRFQVCCIPFWTENVALGDVLETGAEELKSRFRVVQESGRASFGLIFSNSCEPMNQSRVTEDLVQLGCLIETYSPLNVLAIDAATNAVAQEAFDTLRRYQRLGWLRFGKTHIPHIFRHTAPVWKNKVNALVHIAIQSGDYTSTWEELSAKQLAPDRFEICCIPFFAYDLALGDHVITLTEPIGLAENVIQQVEKPSGHETYRVAFIHSTHPPAVKEVLEATKTLGCQYEWYSSALLAIDAPSDSPAQKLADFLWEREQQGHLTYETGRTT